MVMIKTVSQHLERLLAGRRRPPAGDSPHQRSGRPHGSRPRQSAAVHPLPRPRSRKYCLECAAHLLSDRSDPAADGTPPAPELSAVGFGTGVRRRRAARLRVRRISCASLFATWTKVRRSPSGRWAHRPRWSSSSRRAPIDGRKARRIARPCTSAGRTEAPLGLVFARALVERNGGQLEVRSAGEQTAITVWLPSQERWHRRWKTVRSNGKTANSNS